MKSSFVSEKQCSVSISRAKAAGRGEDAYTLLITDAICVPTKLLASLNHAEVKAHALSKGYFPFLMNDCFTTKALVVWGGAWRAIA